jgi:DNA-binding transcriptional ArsR family regulator
MCFIECIESEKVAFIRDKLEGEDFQETTQVFKALADPNRLKIAYALVQTEELCVCDIAHLLSVSIATASHHLRLLRRMGLAKYRKEGKLVFYSLDDNHIKQLVEIALIHRKEGKSDERK